MKVFGRSCNPFQFWLDARYDAFQPRYQALINEVQDLVRSLEKEADYPDIMALPLAKAKKFRNRNQTLSSVTARLNRVVKKLRSSL
ncbi:hypothetical protein IFM58399_09934 [Aspergillus lentulus]|uniref:uncharacterized protein n=1 Tax=Aspergillus lentulus TaxID=293939 RepID=UPI001392C2AF|nr:uncharacterized protein IFM58399_09934 [Aspergillus lentulus]GFF54872.1 hypothetical protein IFM58399_09934 [Aspergillus lentulus]